MKNEQYKNEYDKGLLWSFLLFIFIMVLLILFTYKGNQTAIENKEITQRKGSESILVNLDNLVELSKDDQITADTLRSIFSEKQKWNLENSFNKESYTEANVIFYNHLPYIDYQNYRNDSISIRFSISSNKKESSGIQLFSYSDILKQANEYYNKGNYKKALIYYLSILNEYPNDINGSFYGGICYYNLGDFENSIILFRNAYSTGYQNFKQEANLWIAQSYIHLNKELKAQYWLKNVIEENSYYANQAKQFLENIGVKKND
ncbi:MAG: tetratricopeptide repeat protein [Brumimicrobium sp.]|nr:tetratricopeptide repeat protein [Brumimicrobium sp.]